MAIGTNVGHPRDEEASGPPLRVRDTVVIVPAYGEELGIGPVLRELLDNVHATVLVVNRPNGDRTGAVARDQGACVIDQVGKGKGVAVRQGLQFVNRELPDTRYIGFVDADYTYPTAVLTEMRSILESDAGVGMVIARRVTTKNDGAMLRLFVMGNRILATAHRWFNKVTLQDPLSGLRLVRADILDGWLPVSGGFDVECELNCFVRNVRRLKIVEIPVQYRERLGPKKLGIRHGFLILSRMISLGTRGTASDPDPTNGSTYATRGVTMRRGKPAQAVAACLSDRPDPIRAPEGPNLNR